VVRFVPEQLDVQHGRENGKEAANRNPDFHP
jgi:hypothetical protein